MRMHQIKIFHIFVPNLGEIHQFGHKIAFSGKQRASIDNIRVMFNKIHLSLFTASLRHLFPLFVPGI